MRRILEKQRLGFVATVSEDGRPNLSPKATFVVVDERTIAFGDIRSPGTIRNLRHNPAIAVNFVDPLTRKGFRVAGSAVIYDRGDPLFAAHEPRFDRWAALAARIRSIVLIDVEQAAPVRSPAYDDGAEEAELREQWAATLLAE